MATKRKVPIDMKEKIYERFDDEDDLDRYVRVPKIESYEAWEETADFVETIKDARLYELLSIAIDGKGAFHRFRIRQQVDSWLEEEGLKLLETN